MLAVLDTMKEEFEGKPGCYTVYYNILDGDIHGHSPHCQNFDFYGKSCLHKIAKNEKKVIKSIAHTTYFHV